MRCRRKASRKRRSGPRRHRTTCAPTSTLPLLAGLDMRAVAAWVAGANPGEAEQILRAAGARQWAFTLAEMTGEATKTAATVRMVMSRALSFMADPGAGRQRPARPRRRVRHRRVPGRERHRVPDRRVGRRGRPGRAAVRRHDQRDPLPGRPDRPGLASGRLDPPLLMGLDEVTQICPVPLPAWLSDSGGKGIQVIAVAHGEAQLASRWGDHGRQVVLDTCSVKVFLPGITNPATLRHRLQAVRPGRLEDPRPLPPHLARHRHPRHDPPAALRIRARHPGRLRARDRAAAPGLAQPRLQASPPPQPGTGDTADCLLDGYGEPAPAAALPPGLTGTAGHPGLPARRPDRRRRRRSLPVELARPRTPMAAVLDLLAAHADGSPRPSSDAGDTPRRWTGRDLARRLTQRVDVLGPPAWTRSALARRRRRRRRERAAVRPGADAPLVEARPAGNATTSWSRCAAGSARSTGPATASSPPPSAPAGTSTRCACTSSTSSPNCGPLLYLPDRAHPASLSAQAEFQARILPASRRAARRETARCPPPPPATSARQLPATPDRTEPEAAQ